MSAGTSANDGDGTASASEATPADLFADQLDDGDTLASWVLLGAVRGPGGGRVAALISDEEMPVWELRGILAEALAMLNGPDPE